MGLFVLLTALLLLSVGSLVAMILIAVTRSRGVAHPSCGSCGYAVAGLAQLRCPECGADLRESGIVTPSARWAGRPILWCVLWSLFLPFPAIGASLLVRSAIPRKYASTLTVMLTPGRSTRPFPSTTYTSLQFDLAGEGTARQFTEGTIRLTRPDGSLSNLLVFSLPDLRIADDDQEHAAPQRLGPTIVQEWMMDATGEASGPVLEAEADAIIRHLKSAAAGGSISTSGTFGGASVSSRSMRLDDRGFGLAATSVCVIVWLAGLLLIMWRRRRADRQNSQAST